jgi:hypothetical protein
MKLPIAENAETTEARREKQAGVTRSRPQLRFNVLSPVCTNALSWKNHNKIINIDLPTLPDINGFINSKEAVLMAGPIREVSARPGLLARTGTAVPGLR